MAVEYLLMHDLSLLRFINAELTRGYFLEHNEAKYTERRERVYTCMRIPRELEKLMIFGIFLCLDAFLYVFTLLPLRVFLAVFRFITLPCYGLRSHRGLRMSDRRLLQPAQVCDIFKGVILVICYFMMHYVDYSMMYHLIRGQSVIKLYIIYNMLEVADRLFSSFGQDILDALYWTATEPKERKRAHIGVIPHFFMAVLYVFLHAILIMVQATTLNVAFNSHNKSLLTIMMSNNFVEIKGSVFKKFEKNNLFQMSNSDPFDVARGRCTDEASYAEESTFTDHVEGDDWSDYSDHEEDTSYRLFNTSDYQPLACRVVNTLGLQSAPSTSSAPAIKGAKVLKSPAPTEHYIPVPDPIAKLASEEWAHPLQARRFKNLADRLYALAPDFATKLDVPSIDEPIARLVSRSLLPREGESHLKDTAERRIDFALRKNHEATALSMRASSSASIFSRASMMWLDDLLEDTNPDPVALRRALLKLRKTAAFVADAALDATQLGARAMAAQIVARRTLWLRHWQADSAARLNLSRAPYSGSLLFGEEALKAVLVDPKDAHRPVLATVKNIDHRPLRRFPSFRSNQPFRGTRAGGRGRDFRSYDPNAFRGSWNRHSQGRDLRLACQLRQKPSPTNPTPTTSRGNVGHPAGNGLLGSRSHHCHHKHRKVPDATNIRRRHASRQSARDVHFYNPHCAMGSCPHSVPSMDSVAFSKRHCQLQPSKSSFEPRTAPLLPLVDQGSSPLQGHIVQRTPQNRGNYRCQPHRLGSPLQLPIRSGGLVHRRAISKHQLAGTKGCPFSSTSFSVSVPFGPYAHSNRQHVCKITFEQTGGHQVSSSAGLSLPHLCLGRTTSTIPESRTSQRDLECDSRLAQQTTGLSGRMETSSSHFPSSPVSVRRPLSRPVCFQSQLPASQVLCPIPGLNSRSSGCSDNTVARRSIVRLSSHTIVSQNLEEGPIREGTAGSNSTILATPTMVLRSSGNVNDGSLDISSQARPPIPGSSNAPGPYLAQSNSVAFERGHLRSAGLSDAVIDIMLASRRPSTTRIYQHTWVAFSKWCQSHHHDPSQATVHQVLQFLHSGFMMGLRPNTLRRHASTLSSILSVSSPGDHISSHPFIKRFLRGVALRSPAVVHRFPSWSLLKVLQALQRPPFEPIRTVPLRILSFKVLFLIAITSARRVSELGALSSARHLCVFHKDCVVLKTDPSFRPKVDSVFHCNQDIVLPSFCPNPTHPLEKAWHSLDVRRALKTYLSRTQEI
ncbi:transmembrane anterior posterior transformation protein 1 homolog isoform X3 [Rhineura floridana]|uniref:transmembrane anterior posterior transformation protein 1 homolog isoform X3 n=1 Tax=Rhineura floridana TaxID=261503 RepID=UPI002AC893AE|nr:transmembrane anterior posterior transformation protein 1 homolog isoform X3 [Rhineura floridana]XP_061439876.1 transmembrane anterior posterior transformation protein 1 homolog isoform X3 [Rhineura floridana]